MPQRLPYTKLAPKAYAALSALGHYISTDTTLLARPPRELVRLRASLLNGCDLLHRACTPPNSSTTTSPRPASTPSPTGRTPTPSLPASALPSPTTDAVTNIQAGHVTDEQYAAVNEFFRGKDLADLTLTITTINAWNRLAIAFRS